MKPGFRILKLILVSCSSFATTALFGQTTYTWTGAADGTNLAAAGNWTTNGSTPATTLPNGTFRDIAQWNGRTAGNLILTYGGAGWPGTGSGSLGVNLVLTANQTNSVQIISSVSLSPSLPLFGVTNNSANASFTLGDGTANNLTVTAWPAGALHPFVNNSTAACLINASVKWQAGDNVGYAYDFIGTGDWTVGNYLMPDNGIFTNFLQVAGPGSMSWFTGKTGSYNPTNDTLGAVTITGGTLVIIDPRVLGSVKNQPITNNSSLVFNAAAFSTTFNGIISGTGQLTLNNGDLTLTANNTYTGITVVSNMAMIVNGSSSSAATYVYGGTFAGTGALSGPLILNAGTTFSPGPIFPSMLGAFTINNNLTIGGNLAVDVDKTLSQSNDFVTVTGVLTNTSAGTITVTLHSGSPYVVGDKFMLFSKRLQNGAALNVVGGGVNWVNNLAVDGSISVSPIPFQFTWTGAADGTNLNTPGNFTTDGVHPAITLPDGNDGTGNQEPVVWDGLTGSNLVLFYNTPSWTNIGIGSIGVNFITTTNQTNSVRMTSPVAQSPFLGFFAFTNNSPSAAFVLGDGTTNTLRLSSRPSASIHNFVNNSTAACIIYPNINWVAGDGLGYKYDFGGTGNWIVNSYLVPGNSAAGASAVLVDGPGTVFWSAGAVGKYTPNSILGNIVINGGALVLQSSFPSNHNQLLNTAIIVSTSLTYAPSNGTDSQTFNGPVSGSGRLIVSGGTLTLGANNNYTGATIISNGTLALTTGSIASSPTINLSAGATLDVSGAGGSFTLMPGQTLEGNGTVIGDLDVSGGATIAPGFPIAAPAINGNLGIDSGTIVANINMSLSPSNTLYQVTGSISSTAGTLKLLNFGPSLHANDKFNIFNKAVSGGISIVSPGFSVTNNLAADGSVTVAAVQPPGSNLITPLLSGGQLTLNWPSAWTGLHLQAQTNSLGTNWMTIAGTDATNNYMTALDNSLISVFYRLAP